LRNTKKNEGREKSLSSFPAAKNHPPAQIYRVGVGANSLSASFDLCFSMGKLKPKLAGAVNERGAKKIIENV
jgi:hypothetical protein